MKDTLLVKLREGEPLSLKERIQLIVNLSIPAMLAQVSVIIMQYIDAAMVGQLGANDSASIGLVSTTTWLFGGILSALMTGFTVQVAHQIGAKNNEKARLILKHSFLIVGAFGLVMSGIGVLIAPYLPHWLGGGEQIIQGAYHYFLVYILFIPFTGFNSLSSGLLQASGNMKIPSLLQVFMCILDVIFNSIFIFKSTVFLGIPIHGFGLGVAGAALGTALAQVVVAILMLYFLLVKSPILGLKKHEKFTWHKGYVRECFRIAIPVGIEQVVTTGAMIMVTKIIAPLGNVSIAANSFAVTAESLCYMPGYGIATAATTMIGQSIGAKRHDLTKSLGYLTTALGMLVMAITGTLMYILAPYMISFLSPDPEIVALGTVILQIEAFAEPLYGASMVATGVFRGTGDTFIPSCLNFLSMWAVRIPLSAFLAPRVGLKGVWIAMCLELCTRGILFLIRLKGTKWLKRAESRMQEA